MLSTPQTLQRKKSLPDVAGMPRMADGGGMSREEVSALGSARREEVRRMHEETEKLRANPLLYLVSPQVKVRPTFNQPTSNLFKPKSVVPFVDPPVATATKSLRVLCEWLFCRNLWVVL